VDGGLMIGYGKAGEFFTLILPHCMLELSAVFLAAAGGLRMGWAITDPGPRRRLQALAEEGRATVTLVLGRRRGASAVRSDRGVRDALRAAVLVRIGIGTVAETAFLAYLIAADRSAERRGLSGDIADAPEHALVSGAPGG
jgi:Stage II sporulation protein M